jgi:hypothetical protein
MFITLGWLSREDRISHDADFLLAGQIQVSSLPKGVCTAKFNVLLFNPLGSSDPFHQFERISRSTPHAQGNLSPYAPEHFSAPRVMHANLLVRWVSPIATEDTSAIS